MDDLDPDILKEFNSEWNCEEESTNDSQPNEFLNSSAGSCNTLLSQSEIMDIVDPSTLDELNDEWSDNSSNKSEVYIVPTQFQDDVTPTSRHIEVLSKSFGHSEFRPLQWSIINSLMNKKKDVCAILATGYGKSLCYQFPSLCMGGVTIVISPLISLMEDQVLSLSVKNISACLLGSANTKQADTIKEIFDNKYSLIYCTPEFITGDYGQTFLTQIRNELTLTLIAIDEAHCISSWGHDFRHQYRHLNVFKQTVPEVPILAVTATATPKVKDDIVKSLRLVNPEIVCSGFDRPNLYFSVNLKSKSGIFNDLKRTVLEKVDGQWKFSGSTIIYCITRKETTDVAEELKMNGINALPYHAGLNVSERKHNHMKFIRDNIDCIVATIAFGMGIDKPDVRNIIHWGASNTVESYYQEVGRAGRDGLPAQCISFYSNQDFVILRFIKEKGYSNDNGKKNRELLEKRIKEYLMTRDCRRKYLLSHFEGARVIVPQYTMCCDNCTRKKCESDVEYEGLDKNGLYDFTSDALLFLETVNIMEGRFGLSNYILFLRGSKSNKLYDIYQKHAQHGCGKHHPEPWWKGVGNMLVDNDYLKKTFVKTGQVSYYTYDTSRKGEQFLKEVDNNSSFKLMLVPPPEIFQQLKKKKSNYSSAGFGTLTQMFSPKKTQRFTHTPKIIQLEKKNELHELLLKKRKALADQFNCMPYAVATDAALLSMSEKKPTDFIKLVACKLPGFTEANVEKFGESFLRIIRVNCGFNPDVPKYNKKDILDTIKAQSTAVSDGSPKSIFEVLEKHPMPELKFHSSAQQTYYMFKHMLIHEIMKERSLSESTVINHLNEAIKAGCEIKLEDLGIIKETRKIILGAIQTIGADKLTPLKEACPPHISYNEIKLVLTSYNIRKHLHNLNIPFLEFENFSYDEYIHGKLEENITTPQPSSEQSSIACPQPFIEQSSIACPQPSTSSKLSATQIDLREFDDLLKAAADIDDFMYDSDKTDILSDSDMPETKKIKLNDKENTSSTVNKSVNETQILNENISTNSQSVTNDMKINKLNKKLPPWMKMKKM